MTITKGYATHEAKAPLEPFEFERRELGENDVQIEILYCGVCHSDLHTARNEWKGSHYPVVPGHEIVGKVKGVGSHVKNFKVGDFAAVGCMVDSCRSCTSCLEGEEQYCENEIIFTYNSPDKHSGGYTFGGYSQEIVVDKKFVLHIPKGFKEEDLARVAPLLCAGITTYSPLRHWKVNSHSVVGVVGLGGLGHIAIKIAHAMGAHVVLFTSNKSKFEDGRRLGANEVVDTKDPDAIANCANRFDFILDTVSVSHQLDVYTNLLKKDGTLCLIGAPEIPHPPFQAHTLVSKRRQIAGTLIGGIKETQEMLDFCAKHQLLADIELITIDQINEAYERMLKSDVKYRFVIDAKSL